MLYQCWTMSFQLENNVEKMSFQPENNVVPGLKQYHSNLIPTWKQHCSNVDTTSFQPSNNIAPMLLERHSNLKTTLFQCWNNIISNLKQHCSNVARTSFQPEIMSFQPENNLKIGLKSWHCFNVETKSGLQHWNMVENLTLKQRQDCNVEIRLKKLVNLTTRKQSNINQILTNFAFWVKHVHNKASKKMEATRSSENVQIRHQYCDHTRACSCYILIVAIWHKDITHQCK